MTRLYRYKPRSAPHYVTLAMCDECYQSREGKSDIRGVPLNSKLEKVSDGTSKMCQHQHFVAGAMGPGWNEKPPEVPVQ
jgi:hypothetical protein